MRLSITLVGGSWSSPSPWWAGHEAVHHLGGWDKGVPISLVGGAWGCPSLWWVGHGAVRHPQGGIGVVHHPGGWGMEQSITLVGGTWGCPSPSRRDMGCPSPWWVGHGAVHHPDGWDMRLSVTLKAGFGLSITMRVERGAVSHPWGGAWGCHSQSVPIPGRWQRWGGASRRSGGGAWQQAGPCGHWRLQWAEPRPGWAEPVGHETGPVSACASSRWVGPGRGRGLRGGGASGRVSLRAGGVAEAGWGLKGGVVRRGVA